MGSHGEEKSIQPEDLVSWQQQSWKFNGEGPIPINTGCVSMPMKPSVVTQVSYSVITTLQIKNAEIIMYALNNSSLKVTSFCILSLCRVSMSYAASSRVKNPLP